MSSFMLLFWAPVTVVETPRSPEQARASGEKWHAWAEGLVAKGHTVGGAQLANGGARVEGPGKAVTPGTLTSSGGSVLGGFFTVDAATLADATEIAKGCPMLEHGGTVEVRPIRD